MKFLEKVDVVSGIKSGTLFFYFIFCLISPIVITYSFLFALAVGRAHSFGAWISMWRSNKITWKYFFYVLTLVPLVSFWGMRIVSFDTLAFFTAILFSFHFVYDEFEMYAKKLDVQTLVVSLSPLILLLLSISDFYFQLNISNDIFLILFLVLLILELSFARTLDMRFFQAKMISLFVLASRWVGYLPADVLAVLLAYHYVFWFSYPAYKIYRYKREDFKGFCFIILIIVSSSIYFAFTKEEYGGYLLGLAVRAFYIGTIIHILSTAPFGYYVGLPRPKENVSA